MKYRLQGVTGKLVKLLVISPILLCSYCLSAFEFYTDNALNFGRLAIPRNDAVSTVTLTRTGQTWSTGSIFILEPGTPGEHTISGLSPYTSVAIQTMLPVESAATFTSPPLSITAIDMPSAGNANANGEITFSIGATLSTSGNGEAYVSGATYQFYIPLEITY